MTADTWTIIGTAIIILVAIATSNRSLRAELRADLRGLENGMNDVETRLTERISTFETRLTERINAMETRLGRVEGMLEVVRDSFFGRTRPEPEPATQPPRSSAPP